MTVANPKTGEEFEIQREDLTGKTIHGNKVHGIAYKRGNNWYWYVTCRCGAEGKVKSSLSLEKGQGCNHCLKSKKQRISNPETGFSVMVTSTYEDITGRTINGKDVIGPCRSKAGRIYWDVRCLCGHRYQTQRQSLERSQGCKKCAYKKARPYRRLRPYEAQYNNFVSRAKYPVSITYDEYREIAELNKSCHYCDAPIVWQEYRRQKSRGGSGSNLDRKDASVGYMLNNVVVCCGRCNYAKGTHFSYDQWVSIGKLIKSWGASAYVGPVTPFANSK